MFFVQRLFAVPFGVFILDVVMNQGCLMETFHGHGDFLEILGNRFVGIRSQRLKGRHTKERPPAFARPREPIAANRFGFTFAFAHDRLKGSGANHVSTSSCNLERSSRRVLSSLVR